MDYSKLVEVYERIEATTKRLEMTDLLVELLKEVPPDMMDKAIYLTQGRVYPDYVGIELGLAEKLVLKAMSFTTGLSENRLETLWHELGDMGLVAEQAITIKKQTSLFSEKLTLLKVYQNLTEIARATGSGSQDLKMRLLAELLHNAKPKEAKYIVRTVVGKMRLGIADMTIVDALAIAFGDKEKRDEVERAYNVSSDMGEVAKVLASEGLKGLSNIRLKLNRPIRAMLCERLDTLEEIIERIGASILEFKYDGLRMQAHIGGSSIKIFSRHLEDITGQFPDIVDSLRSAFKGKEAIVEGEAVPIDMNTGEFRPFQEVSRRRGRKYELEEMAAELPVHLFLFDCLYKDGEDLTLKPLQERRKVLESVVRPEDKIQLSQILLTEKADEAQTFFDKAIEGGCEGIIAKAPGSHYEAGARGFQWIKYKREYKSEMSDTVDLVVVGAFSGRGKRAGTYGALLMATYNRKEDSFRTTCKLGTGFDDETLFSLPERLKAWKVPKKPARVDSRMQPDVWFNPAVVLEVLGAEITLSPTHTSAIGAVRSGSGLAVRFPRFTGRWRDDKQPEDATTDEELIEMYRAQLKKVKEETQPSDSS